MAEISSELIYEILKSIRGDIARIDQKTDELKAEMQAFRGHMISLQQDVHNIYGILARHDSRLERIERRLELNETV
jgi:chromosome segregation ATPase